MWISWMCNYFCYYYYYDCCRHCYCCDYTPTFTRRRCLLMCLASWTETATPARNHQEIKSHKKYTKLWLRVHSFIHSLRTASTAAAVLLVADVGSPRKHFPRKSKENKNNFSTQRKWKSHYKSVNVCIRFTRDWIVHSLCEPSRVVQIEPIVINQDIHIVRWLTKEPRKKKKNIMRNTIHENERYYYRGSKVRNYYFA